MVVGHSGDIRAAHMDRASKLKRLKKAGVIRDPLLLIASQRPCLHNPPGYLRHVLEYRDLDWARSVTLQTRPARTRGGRIPCLRIQFDEEKSTYAVSKRFGASTWAMKYGEGGLW